MEPLPREKRTCDICKEKVKDEYHFLFECQVNKQLRDKFLNEMNTLIGDNFKTMNHFDKTKRYLKQQINTYYICLENMFTPLLKNIESILNNLR